MKIGILSMQKVQNYGSFLQAYSLKKRVEELGHSCDFIDIKPGRTLECYKGECSNKHSYSNILSKIDKNIIKRIEHIIFNKKRSNLFQEKLYKQLKLVENNYDEKFDIVIIGSDEVFNCTQNARWGFSKQLLGEEINSDKIITYAASCGFTTYKKICELNIHLEVEEALKNINQFSVRDRNTYNFVKRLTEKDVQFNLDPVLIGDFKKELQSISIDIDKDYILIYGYDNRINNKDEIDAIKKFARDRNLKIISAGFYQRWCDKNILVEPFELLKYVKNAKYIITDTFHGTIFSIKLNKKFATIIRDSNREKVFDLLERFNLNDREVNDLNKLEKIINEDIDYTKINRIIEQETNKSIKYLRDNLK